MVWLYASSMKLNVILDIRIAKGLFSIDFLDFYFSYLQVPSSILAKENMEQDRNPTRSYQSRPKEKPPAHSPFPFFLDLSAPFWYISVQKNTQPELTSNPAKKSNEKHIDQKIHRGVYKIRRRLHTKS